MDDNTLSIGGEKSAQSAPVVAESAPAPEAPVVETPKEEVTEPEVVEVIHETADGEVIPPAEETPAE